MYVYIHNILCTDSGLFSSFEENSVTKTLANPVFIYT